MYNSDIPSRAELLTSAQLLRSTAIAFVAAVGILVTIVLPAEYAIDPTGIGRALRLTEMGEIKTQLAAEAEADRNRDTQSVPAAPPADQRSSLLNTIIGGLFVSPAHAAERVLLAQAAKSDETVFTLKPNEGIEYKLTMAKGAQVNFTWAVQGGAVNYDMHGTATGGGKEKSIRTGRGVAGDQGVLTAETDGAYGWFWRNRGSADVTITLKTNGAYSAIKRMV
ncbi:hypothetical protein FG93_05220 [Bosea sp. LC85]|uniref:hypothetical protein n=1 Tax=Bosea sp. LC85 TaxID=1502851 RepID=UPI0004E3D461|nr:hypothetical protein [Bosea sp. LC85]KFC64624.1 hypothetical protein FG93_05220 [Bosea sp. LC85]